MDINITDLLDVKALTSHKPTDADRTLFHIPISNYQMPPIKNLQQNTNLCFSDVTVYVDGYVDMMVICFTNSGCHA